MRVLVTGGSGMVGRTIKEIKSDTNEWLFPSSSELNLMSIETVDAYLEEWKPTFVIHLAANVGGLFKNLELKVEMLHDNLKMNENLLKSCYKNGVKRGIFFCSTCIFPDPAPSYPMTEEMMMKGEPHPSNASYAWSKRMMYLQCQNYNQQYGCKYLCLTPCNIFGPYDNFSIKNAHVIGAVIHKFYKAQSKNEHLILKTGKDSKRQFITATDVAKITIKTLETFDTIKTDNIILAGKEYYISEVIDSIAKSFEYFNYKILNEEKGQSIKTCSTDRFFNFFPDYIFQDFELELQRTIQWFKTYYETVRR